MAQQTVICIKWGTRYGADYVNRLASMIWRNTARPTRVICFTDDATGIDPRVVIQPLPAIPNIPARVQWTGWRKLSLWQYPLADLGGDVLFFDLDVVITGSIDEFFDFEPGRFAVAENWSEMGQNIGNTTVYRFPAGRMTAIYSDFVRDPEAILAKYRNEQKYISGEAADMVFWPHEWCASFKHNLLPTWPMRFFKTPKLPAGTKLVAFTGKPDPDEARDGRWPVTAAWKRLYKHVRPTPWIAEHWQ
ncbi:MAG: hypothetical protein ABL908_11775 [Hyphomicrobium sp.]